jgi:GTP-binding protein
MNVESVDFVAGAASLAQLNLPPLPEVAVVGPSNVGKSSLLNALVGKKGTARVSKTPGRTQQLNFFRVNERFYLVDLPGYGFAKVPKKVQDSFLRLVEGYLSGSRELRLLLLLQDCRRTPSEKDLVFHRWLVDNHVRHAIVLTKSDKLGRGALAAQVAAVRKGFGIAQGSVAFETFSSLDGSGRQSVWRLITDALSAPRVAAPAGAPDVEDLPAAPADR